VGLDNARMSRETLEIARRGLEQFNQAFTSTELNFDLLAPDVVFDNSNAGLDAAVYRGHDGMRDFLSILQGMWKLQQGEAQEFIHMKAFQSKADALDAVGLTE
jgi:hypothetical protein